MHTQCALPHVPWHASTVCIVLGGACTPQPSLPLAFPFPLASLMHHSLIITLLVPSAPSRSCPPPTIMFDPGQTQVGYVIPTTVVSHFLTDYVRNGSFTGFPALGVQWQRMESETLRRAYGMQPKQKGAFVGMQPRQTGAPMTCSPSRKARLLGCSQSGRVGLNGTQPKQKGAPTACSPSRRVWLLGCTESGKCVYWNAAKAERCVHWHAPADHSVPSRMQLKRMHRSIGMQPKEKGVDRQPKQKVCLMRYVGSGVYTPPSTPAVTPCPGILIRHVGTTCHAASLLNFRPPPEGPFFTPLPPPHPPTTPQSVLIRRVDATSQAASILLHHSLGRAIPTTIPTRTPQPTLSGVLIRRVNAAPHAASVLLPDDVLLSFDGPPKPCFKSSNFPPISFPASWQASTNIPTCTCRPRLSTPTPRRPHPPRQRHVTRRLRSAA